MTKRRKKAPTVGDPNDPDGLLVWTRRYVEHLRVRNYSERTIVTTDAALKMFIAWADDRSLSRPAQISRPILEAFQRWLFYRRKPSGRPMAFSSQRVVLQKLRGFFRFLARGNAVLWNPAADLEMPRVEKKLPKAVLTEAEAEKVLALPDVTDAIGLRDRAMLEVLYSTGIRRHELAGLHVGEIDFDRETVFIRLGKGRKDRVVPIGERALHWVQRYLDEARPQLVMNPDDGFLWLTEQGTPPAIAYLTILMRWYLDESKVGKGGAVHIWRHSMATAMIEAGCDIRHLQEILGHSETSTTAIYTRISVRRLKVVHAQFHPASKLVAKPKAIAANETEPTAEELLAALESESDEDDVSQ